MPANKNLKSIPLPMKVKFGQKPKTLFKTLENNVSIELINAPSYESLLEYLPNFCEATWAENPHKKYSREEAEQVLIKMFQGKTLPTALETMRFTFLLKGLTYVEVTHILRYRGASFSAQCTADRFQHDDDVMVPESIVNSEEFLERYMRLCNEMKELYADMVDSKKISILDARYILPKASESFYYMSMNFKDVLHFVRQRIDRAIQPKSDNILAYQMWYEMCKQYPILASLDLVDFDAPSYFWIKTARTGHSSNICIPEKHNDTFEWNPDDFIYQVEREELCGTNSDAKSTFNEIKDDYADRIKEIKEEFLKNHK